MIRKVVRLVGCALWWLVLVVVTVAILVGPTLLCAGILLAASLLVGGSIVQHIVFTLVGVVLGVYEFLWKAKWPSDPPRPKEPIDSPPRDSREIVDAYRVNGIPFR